MLKSSDLFNYQLIFNEDLTASTSLPACHVLWWQPGVFVYWKTMNTIKEKLFFLPSVRTRHHRGGEGGGVGGGALRSIVKRSEETDSLPEIITPSQVIRREVGGTAILACSVENLGQYVVMWKQDGRVISGQSAGPTSPPAAAATTDHFSRELAGEERRPDQTLRHRHRVQPLPLCSHSGGWGESDWNVANFLLSGRQWVHLWSGRHGETNQHHSQTGGSGGSQGTV